jgi:tRNA-Thr(GGU) m(6)t(6)A37 methyltransferase TsaA
MKGLPAVVEILPEYRTALSGLSKCSHIWVLCWFDRADRSVLRARPRKISGALPERGVFATRSPDRPNPVALTCARIVSTNGLKIKLAGLDAIDGTPVVDIKPYSVGTDSVPCASKPDYSVKYKVVSDNFIANTFARSALNMCGKLDNDAMKAAAFALKYTRQTCDAPENGAQEIRHGGLKASGVDALYAIFGLAPSSCAVKKGNFSGDKIRVKTRRGVIKISLAPKELRAFKAMISETLLV